MKSEKFDARLSEMLPKLVAFRRDLHAHPEVAFQEFRTAEKVAEWLKRLPGVSIRTGLHGTGVEATLGAGRDGPCLAFRADMDALPMEDACGCPYASVNPGVTHACGHDGHVTCLLGAATMMAMEPGLLAGPVRFIFQPAEEGGGGARFMVEEGVLENPRPVAIFGLHGWPEIPLGQVGIRAGAFMASTDAIDITIHGRGTHAARPHDGIDPVVAAAHVVVALQTVVSRLTNPTEPAVVTIGSLHAGTARNVIPDKAHMRGTLRALSEDKRQAGRHAIRQVAEQTAAAFGAKAEVVITEGYPVNINDEKLKQYADSIVMATLGAARMAPELPVSMGGEDFAYYTQHVPGCFMRLGVGTPGCPTLHNAAYDFNDEAIATGVAIFCALAWGWRDREAAGGDDGGEA